MKGHSVRNLELEDQDAILVALEQDALGVTGAQDSALMVRQSQKETQTQIIIMTLKFVKKQVKHSFTIDPY